MNSDSQHIQASKVRSDIREYLKEGKNSISEFTFLEYSNQYIQIKVC